MNGPELVRRIHRERQEWRTAGEGPEVSWTARGLDRALEIARVMAKEEQMRARETRPRLSRWLAGDLFRCARQALDYLKRGDRKRAIYTLEEAVRMCQEVHRGHQR